MKFLTVAISFLFSAIAFAVPDFSIYKDISGIRVYRDSDKHNIWYLSPPELNLSVDDDNTPAYHLDFYRYSGRKGTGDGNKFWAKGVLSVEVERTHPKSTLKKLRKELKRSHGKGIKLKNMPVGDSRYRVIFADSDKQWSKPSLWSSKKVVIPLDEHMAQLLWDAAGKGQTLLSIEVEQNISGIASDPAKLSEVTVNQTVDIVDKETLVKKEDRTNRLIQISINNTIGINLDMDRYSEKFKRYDLDATAARGYTQVDVLCFDFIENSISSLYAVLVDLAIHTEGRDLVETVRFDHNSAPRQLVRFKLSKNLNEKYGYRITYVYQDGSKRIGKWQSKNGEAFLDITTFPDITNSSVTNTNQLSDEDS